jgi:peroxiredoxin
VQLQNDLPTIRASGAAVVGVSVDPIATSRALADQLHLGYPIVQDVNHQLGSAFGDFHVPTAGMDMGPVDNHAIFVLDQHGVVRWKAMAADTMHVPDQDVIAALRRM